MKRRTLKIAIWHITREDAGGGEVHEPELRFTGQKVSEYLIDSTSPKITAGNEVMDVGEFEPSSEQTKIASSTRTDQTADINAYISLEDVVRFSLGSWKTAN